MHNWAHPARSYQVSELSTLCTYSTWWWGNLKYCVLSHEIQDWECWCLPHSLQPTISTPTDQSQSPGRVLPLCWVIWMCRRFDPLFWHSEDWTRSFWGIFSHPPTPKRSFGVLKWPILTEFDLFGPKFHFSLYLFGSNFQRPAAHPHQFSDRVPPPPPPGHSQDLWHQVDLLRYRVNHSIFYTSH